MGATLKIYEITTQEVGNRSKKTLLEVANVWNSELIEEISDNMYKHWHLSSDCGAEFELQGHEILEFAEEIKKYDKDFKDNEIDIDEWYRCILSY
jgi:hypothetical protein